ncbi:nucleotide exchange factor GrpE [Sediminibacillus massiliensis]|uniref:nucleotide exchange factor GrpE n=1 Tax=Sediminibacillus massiliensis TaxID=1926277 RepID=UPI0009888676
MGVSFVADNEKQEQSYGQEELQDQEIIEDTDQELVDEADDTEVNNEEFEALKKEKDELYDRLLRLQAEYDNFRKRTQKEKEADRKYKSQALVTELLPVLDNFERALETEIKEDSTESFIDGVKMVHRQLKDALEKEGVEEVKAEGETFDPNVHQAVMQVEDDQYESNTVVQELQKGYMLKDRVIRPAMVKVNQ